MATRGLNFDIRMFVRQPRYEIRALLDRLRASSRVVRFCQRLTGSSGARIEQALEHLRASMLEDRVRVRMAREAVRPFEAGAMGRDLCRALYVIARAQRPACIVETGVSAGVSTAHLLQAIVDNGRPYGRLYSVDLTPEAAPRRFVFARWAHRPLELARAQARLRSGWAIPDDLRAPWHLCPGDTFSVLPGLLDSVSPVDLFVHDSDHTVTCQLFEYRTAWPCLRPGGVLLSHDVDASRAFIEFAASVRQRPVYLGTKTGALVKP